MKQTTSPSGVRATLKQTLESAAGLRLSIYALVLVVLALCVYGFMHSAPPRSVIISAGPAGSQFERVAKKYQAILAKDGVKVIILSSQGSLENIHRLADRKQHVDVAFVQGGIADEVSTDNLVSLGSMFYEPMWIFYRAPAPLTLLTQFKGKTLVLGPPGSGAHDLALDLLDLNGIKPGGETTLLDTTSGDASSALLGGKVDAIFLMGDSGDIKVIGKLLRDPNIHVFDFALADAYTRKITTLSKFTVPRGAINIENDIPAESLALIGPTVELVARKGLHPAISDLLLEAAQEVHSKPSLLQERDEFPAPVEHEFKISDDAQRYYTSGKTFLYRHLPFWLASLADRIFVVALPILVLLVPGLRLLPALYNWRMRARILHWYGALLMLERDIGAGKENQNEELLRRLAILERHVSHLKVPVAFADQFYVLRQHIDYVREKLKNRNGLHEGAESP
jgi:TRAP-type uncharacterized transport system substrate-binding protein